MRCCYWSIFSNFPNFIKIATTLLPTNCDLDNTTCYSIPMTTCFFNFLLLLSLLPGRLTLNKKNDLFCNEMMLTTIKDVLTKGLPIWYHLNNPNKLAAEKKKRAKQNLFPYYYYSLYYLATLPHTCCPVILVQDCCSWNSMMIIQMLTQMKMSIDLRFCKIYDAGGTGWCPFIFSFLILGPWFS